MATRTFPELVWGSFWTAFRAECEGGDYHDGSAEDKVVSLEKASATRSTTKIDPVAASGSG
eukprot:7141576-Alexandrium_andersonii.AAC.1